MPRANVLPFQVRVRIIRTLVEGNSIRATARLTCADKDAVMRLGFLVGTGCLQLHDRLVGGVTADFLEIDEVWAYVGRHERRKKKSDPEDWGDVYTMFAVDAETKLVPSFETGKRTLDTATDFAQDLRARVDGKPQITVDGWPLWIESMRRAFGHDGADVGMTVKEYQKECRPDDTSKGCGRVKSQNKTVIFGDPLQSHITTSHAERVNLTTRMQQRRLTRLTNGYSKKAVNLRAAMGLHYFWYNFVRRHQTIGTTPALESGVATHEWTLDEMVQAALEEMGEMNKPTYSKRPRRVTRKTHAMEADWQEWSPNPLG